MRSSIEYMSGLAVLSSPFAIHVGDTIFELRKMANVKVYVPEFVWNEVARGKSSKLHIKKRTITERPAGAAAETEGKFTSFFEALELVVPTEKSTRDLVEGIDFPTKMQESERTEEVAGKRTELSYEELVPKGVTKVKQFLKDASSDRIKALLEYLKVDSKSKLTKTMTDIKGIKTICENIDTKASIWDKKMQATKRIGDSQSSSQLLRSVAKGAKSHVTSKLKFDRILAAGEVKFARKIFFV